MKQAPLRNFHLPLPEDLYRTLRDEALAAKRPATTLARQAIEAWLHERKKAAVREAERLGIKSVPALALEGQVFHINFGASLNDLK